MKVLLVDDEVYVLQGMKKLPFWDRLGIDSIFLANSGPEALRIVQQEELDLLITDIYMPSMTGLELIQEIRKTNKELPVIILSGYNNFEDVSLALTYGVIRYILKPTTADEMETVIRETLNEYILKKTQKREYETFMKNYQANVDAMRESIAFQMINGGKTIKHRKGLTQQLHWLKINPDIADRGIVLCIRIQRDIWGQREEEWLGTLFAAMRIIGENIDWKCFCQIQEDILAVLLSASKISDQGEIEDPQRMISSLFDQARIEANIGVGNEYTHISGCRDSYKQALEALEASEEAGPQQVVFYRDLVQYESITEQYLVKMPLIVNALREGDTGELQTHLNDARAMLSQYCMDIDVMRNLSAWLIGSMAVVLSEQYTACFEKQVMKNWMTQIYEKQSRQQLLDVLDEIVNTIDHTINLFLASQKQNRYVVAIKKYVAEHYAKEITLNALANELHLSRNYLSNIFTKSEGISFMTYLTKFRIEKAKELFCTESLLTYEVGQRVGYNDPAYFCKVFKRCEGITPQEFLRKILEQYKLS